MKVSELSGAKLDALVAKALGWKTYKEERGEYTLCVTQAPGEREPWMKSKDWQERKPKYEEVPLDVAITVGFFGRGIPKFSTDWSQGGPIQEREKIEVHYNQYAEKWIARYFDGNRFTGDTPLVAICLAFVGEKFGIEVPEE